MNAFSNSWGLMKESLRVLEEDKELLILPVLSGIACILVGLSFILPFVLVTIGAGSSIEGPRGLAYLPLAFVFYLVTYFIITFFNTAVVACASLRMEGGDPTIGYGLRVAADNLVPILAWAALSATVGMILKGLEKRFDWLGRLILGVIGIAWTLVTYLIVPVIIFEKRTIFESIKRSADLATQNWGRQVVGSVGLGLAYFLLMIPGFVPLIAGAFTQTWQGAVFGGVITALYLVLLATVISALRGVYTAALYRYATTRQVPAGFSPRYFTQAFQPK